MRSCGPTICDKTQHVTAIIDVDGATICDKTQHVTAIIDVDGATICDETQRVTTIIDVDGAPVVEPSHNSASGHLQSKLRTCPYCRLLFTTDRELCDHIRSQHADRRYSCVQCACTFVSKEGLNRHVRHVHQKLVKFKGIRRSQKLPRSHGHACRCQSKCVYDMPGTIYFRAQFESACYAFSSGCY